MLEIKTKSGCTSSYCNTINTYKKCDIKPDFTYAPDPSNSRLIYLQPLSADSLLRYRWMLNGSQEIYTPYWFSDPGIYSITMYVTDSIHHCYDSTVKTISIYANCYDTLSAGFTNTPNPGLPNQITFTPESNEPIANQLWKIYAVDNLLDSIIAESNHSVTYTFPDTGYYKIYGIFYTKNGCAKEVIEYIHITSVGRNSPRQSIVTYPNPADSYVLLPFNATTNGTIKITVYNVIGKPVLTRQENLFQGKNQIRIPIQQLNKGQYYIDMQFNGERTKSVFQKL
ncbi:MAG: T9SS type A sorting domain-containing protein [Agriterribacter sp.]